MKLNGQTELNFGSQREPIQERFERFDANNPKVWELFVQFATQAAQSGRPFSARMVTMRLVWDVRFVTKSDDSFKINNDFSSRYARKFAKEYPQYAHLLEFRELTEPKRFTQTQAELSLDKVV